MTTSDFATENATNDSFLIWKFDTPWKHQKTVRFSDVFRGERKCALGKNGLTQDISHSVLIQKLKTCYKSKVNILV